MMPKRLSMSLKRRFLPMLIERDGGYVCFYCKKQLDYKTAVFDHLNNNNEDNRLENLVLACQSCNIKKIGNNTMQLQASEKMELNESSIFVGEKKYSTDNASEEEAIEVSKEIDINTTNFQITEQYIEEITHTKGSISFSDALNSSVYLCKKKTGHGSQQSVRNYLAALTSPAGPFEMIRDKDGKKVIFKREIINVEMRDMALIDDTQKPESTICDIPQNGKLLDNTMNLRGKHLDKFF